MPPTSKAVLAIDQYDPNEGRRLHFYAKGDLIPLVPQGIWQIDRGLVQLSTLCPNGEEVLLGWAGTATFFGLWMTLLQAYQATALCDVYLRWFSVTEIEASPRLSQMILPQMGRRMRQAEALLAIVGQRRVEDRLQRLLLLLKKEIGQPVAGGTRLGARLTHQHIASAIGTTRVTITRLLSKLQQQGSISLDCDRHIILKDESFASISDW
ncbi:Crp/Fnr family transcriptional regulator [Trichocoleus sp. Lan]|uniref:Crp/Fnr family transcriptional regulator n=1 Tax=unclassified Trichocoleus TaxID=2628910 RepID=UPI00329709AD